MAAPRHPPLSLRPFGCNPAPPPAGDRREGRDGRGQSLRQKGPAMTHNDSTLLSPDTDELDPVDREPHSASPTAQLLDELALYGHRPGEDEPDPRPLPEPETIGAQLDAVIETLGAMLTGTRLEDD